MRGRASQGRGELLFTQRQGGRNGPLGECGKAGQQTPRVPERLHGWGARRGALAALQIFV